ncbi:MAG: 3-oxoacyl-ACP reductase FabG [Clostridiales bacterium]|jgi:3-oxoacyl-[acyl-carrier protein] reductase|nr:3-oxoacyl-ACP reductase FabG [Clostridiales bacterium]
MKKVALVTGGSRGIGKAVSRVLAEEGYFVAINYFRSEEAAVLLADELNGLAVYADVADDNEVAEMFKIINDKVGSVELLVNNAGIADYSLFCEITPERWRRVFSVNVDGIYHCCRFALPDMIRKKTGNIVNISSMWGQVGASCETVYSASKAAVIGLTKALAKEVGPSGIRVNCIAPGCIMTDMLDGFSNTDLNDLTSNTPLLRLGTAKDIAETARFLSSEKSGFITGQILGVNGGFVV